MDTAADDAPERCLWCPDWRFEWVDLPDGTSVLREWHLPTCTVAIDGVDED